MPLDYAAMGRVERMLARREQCLSIEVLVSRRDGALLKELAADEHVTLRGLVRLALDQYLRAHGMPPLDTIRKMRCDA